MKTLARPRAMSPERGTSGSPATAGRRAPTAVRVGGGLLAAAGLIAAGVVAVGFLTRPGDSAAPAATPAAASAGIDAPTGSGVTAGTNAIAALEARTTTDPSDLPAWQELSRRYLQQAIRTSDPAFYDLTRRSLQTADALAPGDHATTVTEGVLALSLHDFSRALELGRAAHEQAADDPDPLSILIDANVELGRYDEAETHIGELLQRRPGSAALSRLSYLRELHGDLQGARLAMLQAEQASGTPADRATIATFVGDQLLAERDLSGAANAYDRAERDSPGLLTTALGEARLAAADGRLDTAIAGLSRVVERTPTPATATLLAELQQAAGQDDQAAASLALAQAGTQLLVSAGSTVDLESAVFLADHGDAVRAVDAAQRAYGARRTVFTADALGWALTRAGRPAEALPYVQEALQLGTRAPGLHAHAALAYAANGLDDQARAALDTAFASSAWLVPALRPGIATLADRLGVSVPADWRP